MSSIPFFFDRDELNALASERSAAYAAADPFPHAVFDDFLPPAVLREVIDAFPAPGELAFKKFDDPLQRKLAAREDDRFPTPIRLLLSQFNSSTFVDFIEELTGIDKLIPDPHYEGGGLHQIEPGGLLKVHVDFNRHPRLELDRRVNVLLYLNEDWDESYGGHLQLWDQDMERCAQKVLPIANRLVVFSTTDFSYHGHPDPLTCPDGRFRRSLALYYYSNGRPKEEVKDVAARSTVFRRRPGESIRPSLHEMAQLLLPPIFLHAVEKIGARRR